MNHTVGINTDYTPSRVEKHKDFAGEISIHNFSTGECENTRHWFTAVERVTWKKYKDSVSKKGGK